MLFTQFFYVFAEAPQTVTLTVKDMPLDKVCKEIEKQTGFYFVYANNLNPQKHLVTLNLKQAPIETALQQLFQGLPFSYKIIDKVIVVNTVIQNFNHEAKMTEEGGPGNDPKSPEVKGRVTNKHGEPLANASIVCKKSRKAVTTNANGEFKFKGINPDDILTVSYIGYKPQSVKVGDTKSFVMSLDPADNELDKVVVQAYGVTTQRLNTGNITKVTAEEIEKQPVNNVLAAIEGRVPGLIVTQNTGIPGGSFTVQIRGKNSIVNGSDPFYVIDGVPYSSQLPGSLVNVSLAGGNPLNFINPYDIESVEVLKDADATAIYGSRAANGAILITTKKGKAGGMKFDLNAYSGFTLPGKDIKTLNTQQYLAMRREAFRNDGATPGPGDHDINGDWDTTRYTDWSKVFINKGHYTNAQASVSGGNANTQYLIGAGYYRQTTGFPTLLPHDGADQHASAHFNISTLSPDKKFRLTLTGSYMADNNTVQSSDFTNYRLTMLPDAPALFNPDGSLNWAPLVPGQAGTFSNPYGILYVKYKGITSNLVSNAMISYTLMRGLELNASLGYTNTQTDETHTFPTTMNDPGKHVVTGSSEFNTLNTHSWIIEPQLNYKLQVGAGELTALLGTSFHESNSSTKYYSCSGFISDALLEDIQAASSVIGNSNSSQYKYQAVFGRFNYNWQDKYLVNLSARRDGSSRFGPGKQFADFGAIGAAWIFSKESFFQRSLPFISFGKLRGSYGTAGNDQVGDYKFIDLYTPTSYPYQGFQGLYPTNLFNPELAWETTKKLEGGIELGFFKDRVVIQASFYRNRSGNQLVNTPISTVTGFNTIPSNLPALVQNSGKEFMVNTVNIKTKDFTWSSALNLTIARNKLIAFPNLASSSYANTLFIGKSVSVMRLYRYMGVNDTTGIYQFAAAHGGTTYNPDYLLDPFTTLDPAPKFYGGFQNSLRYKNFSLDFFFQFVSQKGQKLIAAYNVMPGMMFNQPITVLNHWQLPGDKNKLYQKFSQAFFDSAYSALGYMQQSDFAYGDASFIRLQNLSVSWQLPQKWRQKMHLENCRVYIQGQNLLTITSYEGIDPESRGYVTGPRKVWTAGLQIAW